MKRGKKTLINTAAGMLEEIIAVICGFILPRLILSAFGSKYNGLTSSISQFLAYAILLRSGIGGATRAALYKPLAEHNQKEIDGIVKATDIFMKKIGLILAVSIVGFATVYPFMVKNEFGWFFTFTLFLVIGIDTFANSFFGITYLIVLQADQRIWVASIAKTVCNILNVAVASALILNDAPIHLVKLGSSLVYLIYPLFLNYYVHKRYHIDPHAEPDNKAIAQRWDAFWHQVAEFVMNNTDVTVLTAFTNLLEVSVYSVHNMVISGLKRVVNSLASGLEAAFGNMLAKNEDQALRENLSVIETMIYALCTVAYGSAIILMASFVRIYTKGITDTEYVRPLFALVLFLAQFFNGIRKPYQMVVSAAGHFKQTKKGAMLEPVINLSLSILLVIKYGLVGVAAGTLAATVFRTIQYSVYMSRNIVKRSMMIPAIRILLSFAEGGITYAVIRLINLPEPSTYLAWALNGMITVIVASLAVGTGSLLFFRTDCIKFVQKLKRAVKA